MVSLNIALEYLRETKTYRQRFYRQIKDRSAAFSTQLTEDKEIELDPDLTGALVLRSVTSGGEDMPLFITSAVQNGELLDLPSRLRQIIDNLPQLIIFNDEDKEVSGLWNIP